MKKIEEAGGTTVLPKSSISNLGFFAVVKDTEGNIIGLWEDTKKECCFFHKSSCTKCALRVKARKKKIKFCQ